MPKIDIATAPVRRGSSYPAPFRDIVSARVAHRLGDAVGLTHFGVNLVRIPPGAWSSQRHWHTHEDEFVWIVEGELVMVTDAGEQVMRAGDCAGFPAGDTDGHHFQNRSAADAVILAVGNRSAADACDYPGIDMKTIPDDQNPDDRSPFVHRDGTPYEP